MRATDLMAVVDHNERLRRRKEIRSALADIAGGSQALSELDFTTLVVRQFGLPEPSRQVPRLDGNGRRRWLDVYWERARLVVEIDGAAHWIIRYQPEYVAAKIRQALRDAGYRC